VQKLGQLLDRANVSRLGLALSVTAMTQGLILKTGQWLQYIEFDRKNGAGTKIRTRDLLITNQLLYQLSYTGTGYIRGIAFYVLIAFSAMFLDKKFIPHQPQVVAWIPVPDQKFVQRCHHLDLQVQFLLLL
jgi:hypothetical protein